MPNTLRKKSRVRAGASLVKSKKKLTKFKPFVRSRHPSHSDLRDSLPYLSFRSVVRLGSTTVLNDKFSREGSRIECNTVQAVRNSSNKETMKQCFDNNSVKTAEWYSFSNNSSTTVHKSGTNTEPVSITDLPYPIVCKNKYGSRGNGNTLINSIEELRDWMRNKNTSRYIIEKFYNYSKEYRLHITEEGCFYTCRKMLRNDIPEDQRWYRNDSNCVWILEENDSFGRPSCWDEIVENSVMALEATGLDVGAVDVKVQKETNNRGNRRENVDFIIIEINSAPSFGEITKEKYIQEIPKILKEKYENR